MRIYNYAGFRLRAPPYALNQTRIGLLFLAYVFGMLASSMAGMLADQLGRPRVFAFATLVTILGLALTLLQQLIVVIVGIIIITVGFFMVHSVASGWVAYLASRNKSHAASLYLFSYYLGSSVPGSLVGWFWREGGWAAVIGFCCALMIVVLGITVDSELGILGQSAPQLSSVVNLVAADLGFSLVPASMRQLQVKGVVYRDVKGDAPVARLALAFRRGDTSKIIRNFIAQAVA